MALFAHRPSGVHALPVELLARIFVLGANYDYPYDGSPFLLKPDQDYYFTPSSNFQLLVSHICAHWRQIALRTSSLWSVLHFREPAHLPRAVEYLRRCTAPNQLLDILVDTVAPSDHIPGVTLCRDQIHDIFHIIIPYVQRWRAFHLKVRDNDCKIAARQHLSSCGPAPNLETLQLYHFEDYRTSQNLYFATYRPPVMVFSNVLPRLKNVSLIGVNLPWAASPYLIHLHYLELALHPESIRPSYEYWDNMLRNSPELRALSLHYSGPRLANGDPANNWPSADDKIYNESLEHLSLTDLDPDYLCQLMERLVLPGVKRLSLDLPDQDFSPFIELVAGAHDSHVSHVDPSIAPLGSPTASSTLSPSSPLGNLSPASSTSTLSPAYPSHNGHLPLPYLAKLETLTVTALECSKASLRTLLLASKGLQTLEVDFQRVPECFDELLRETVEIEGDDERFEERREDDSSIDVASDLRDSMSTRLNIICEPFPYLHQRRIRRTCVLPNLRQIVVSGLSGTRIARLIHHREVAASVCEPKNGLGLRRVERWLVKWSERRRGRDPVLDSLIDAGWVGEDGQKVRVESFEDDAEDDYDDEGEELGEGESEAMEGDDDETDEDE